MIRVPQLPLLSAEDDQYLYHGTYIQNPTAKILIDHFPQPPFVSQIFSSEHNTGAYCSLLLPSLIRSSAMGQVSSTEITGRSERYGNGIDKIVSSATANESPDPFHRSPISPRLLPPSNPIVLPTPKPTISKLDSRPSLLSLRKPSKASTISVTENLPKPPSLSSRVVRKISKSRKGSIAHRSTTPTPALPLMGSTEAEVSENISVGGSGPSSFIRYPVQQSNHQKLSSSLDSSSFSGQSIPLITPSISRRNLHNPPHTPIHQITRITYIRPASASSSSTRSPTQTTAAHSPKTRTRAEREWRARVAAISASTKAKNGEQVVVRREIGEVSPAYKGPVPPRRRPGPTNPIPVVPHPIPKDVGPAHKLSPHFITPVIPSPSGRSFTSAKSFATLGYYASSPVDTTQPNSDICQPTYLQATSLSTTDTSVSPLSLRQRHLRMPSLPRSVSSFYASPDSRESTRPSSLAASTFLSPVPIANGGTELAGRGDGSAAIGGLSVDDHLLFDISIDPSSIPRTPTKPLSALFPPISNPSNFAPLTPTTQQSHTPPTSTRTPTQRSHEPRRYSDQHTPPPSIAFGQGPETPRSRARKERILSLPILDTTSPNRQNITPIQSHLNYRTGQSSSPEEANTSLGQTETTSPSVPSLISCDISTPTPPKSHPSGIGKSGLIATPTTPCSPMTAYILSAENIDLTFSVDHTLPSSPAGWGGGGDGWKQGGLGRKNENGAGVVKEIQHPFASCFDAPSPPRFGKDVRYYAVEKKVDQSSRIIVGNTGGGRVGKPTFQPLRDTSTSTLDLTLPKTQSTNTTNTSQRKPTPASHPLRAKTPNGLPSSRTAVLGTVEKQERTRGKVVIDLCPGMQDGNRARPPKSGMDARDLERWLAGTTGATSSG